MTITHISIDHTRTDDNLKPGRGLCGLCLNMSAIVYDADILDTDGQTFLWICLTCLRKQSHFNTPAGHEAVVDSETVKSQEGNTSGLLASESSQSHFLAQSPFPEKHEEEASVASEDESSSKVVIPSESASVHPSHVDATRKSGGESDDTGSVTSSVPPKGVLDEIDRVFSWADCQENLSRKDLLDQLYHDVLDILMKNKSAPMTIPMIDDCGVCGHDAEENLSGRCEFMKCKCTVGTKLRSV